MNYKVENKTLSSGYGKGWTRTPWAVILHYTATYTEPQTYNILKKRGLSVHFTVERDGKLVRYVEDKDRAWHAGTSSWCGLSGLNHHAFGVEIVNFGWGDGELIGKSPGYVYRNKADPEIIKSDKEFYRDERYKTSDGKMVTTRVVTSQLMKKYPDHRKAWANKMWVEYPDQQIDAISWQVWNWMKEYKILPENIIGHEHIAPDRKSDPGPAFPWDKLNTNISEMAKKEMPILIDVNFNRNLRIKAVQSQCARMGLPIGDIDGWWGSKTSEAINQARDLYGEIYNFDDLVIDPDNLTNISFALKKIPGFDPGRR
jgi:N-acetyl-anhydromuramyl-L-alanine amidase AmpD